MRLHRLAFAFIFASATNVGAQAVGLPSRQQLWIGQGGDTPNVNPHFAEPSQAFGVDFMVTGSVKSGDRVTRGEVIGRCGNSGHTTVPHIHLHAPASPRFQQGLGLNVTYGPIHVNLNGKEFDNVEWPMLTGLWVRMH